MIRGTRASRGAALGRGEAHTFAVLALHQAVTKVGRIAGLTDGPGASGDADAAPIGGRRAVGRGVAARIAVGSGSTGLCFRGEGDALRGSALLAAIRGGIAGCGAAFPGWGTGIAEAVEARRTGIVAEQAGGAGLTVAWRRLADSPGTGAPIPKTPEVTLTAQNRIDVAVAGGSGTTVHDRRVRRALLSLIMAEGTPFALSRPGARFTERNGRTAGSA